MSSDEDDVEVTAVVKAEVAAVVKAEVTSVVNGDELEIVDGGDEINAAASTIVSHAIASVGGEKKKKSRGSWPKMKEVKLAVDGREKFVYPFLDDKINQKDTVLVKMLTELHPFDVGHGGRTGAWKSFLEAVKSEKDENGILIFPTLSMNAMKDRWEDYKSFVRFHREAVKGNKGFDDNAPSNLLTNLYKLVEMNDSMVALQAEQRKKLDDAIADRAEAEQICKFAIGEIPKVEKKNLKTKGAVPQDEDEAAVKAPPKAKRMLEMINTSAGAIASRQENKKIFLEKKAVALEEKAKAIAKKVLNEEKAAEVQQKQHQEQMEILSHQLQLQKDDYQLRRDELAVRAREAETRALEAAAQREFMNKTLELLFKNKDNKDDDK